MSSIRNPQQSSEGAVRDQITEGIVDNWLDNTAGTDGDGDSTSSAKQGRTKGAHGKGGMPHISAHGHQADSVSTKGSEPAASTPGQQSDSSLPHNDSEPSDETSQHFEAIDNLVAGSDAGSAGARAAGAQAPADNANVKAPVSDVATGGSKDAKAASGTGAASTTSPATGASAASIASSITASLSSGSSALPAAVQTALTQLSQDLAASPPNTEKIATDTTTYVAALKEAGLTNAQITDNINTIASDPAIPPSAASALVEAAKNGINTDDSNKDKESSIQVQKKLDKKKDAAVAAGQQAAQAAAQQAQDYADNGGGNSGGGAADSTGDSADPSVTASGASAGQSGDGQYGDVNVPANSKTYKGMSLDQLEQSSGPVGQAIRAHPELVDDIKKASAATGVPEGLLAGLCYAETTFGADPTTTYDADGQPTGGVTQVQQSIVSAYTGGSMSNPADNIMACAKGLAQFYNSTQSWGAALRGWNSFDPTDSGNRQTLAGLTNLRETDGGGTPEYVSNILSYICEGKDPPG